MKMKILITGISSEMMLKFLSLIDFSKYEVIGITRNPELIQLDNIEIIKGDIREINNLANHIKGCHMVIHAAAVTHSFKEKEYYQVNLDATKKLVEIAKVCSVKRFIFISSNTAGTESGAYGLSKLLAEEYIQKNFSGWTIFRPSEIYGGNKKEGIEKLINSAIDKSVVFCPLDVPSKFFPIHIDDAVQIMYNDTFNNEYINKIVVINGSKGLSFLEVIELTRTISNSKVTVVFVKKKLMFILMKLAQMLPFYIGILPDQISRLYSIKHHENSNDNLMEIETYIKKLVESRKRLPGA